MQVLEKEAMLINFTEERDRLIELLNALRVKSGLKERVVNLCGIGGSSKTSVLNAARELIDEKVAIDQRPLHYLEFNFGLEKDVHQDIYRSRLYSSNKFYEVLRQKLTDELEVKLGQESPGRTKNKASRKKEKESEKEAGNKSLVEAFANYADNKEPLVFLFENIVQVSSWFKEVEEQFITPLLERSQNVLFLLISRAPARISRFELRRQLAIINLPPLVVPTSEEKNRNSVQQVQVYLNARLPQAGDWAAEWLLRLSQGYPEVIEKLVETAGVQELLSNAELTSATLPAELNKVILALNQELSEKYLVFDGITTKQKQFLLNLMKILPIYTRFDVPLLQTTWLWFMDYMQQQGLKDLIPPESYIAVAQHLVESGLARWLDELRGYVLDVRFRHLAALALKLEDPERFRTYHQKVAEFYLLRLNYPYDEPETRAVFTAQLLYHQAQSHNLEGLQASIDTLKNNLKNNRLAFIQAFKKHWELGNSNTTDESIRVEEATKRELREALAEFGTQTQAQLVEELERILSEAQ
jgi:hypothetical protein